MILQVTSFFPDFPKPFPKLSRKKHPPRNADCGPKGCASGSAWGSKSTGKLPWAAKKTLKGKHIPSWKRYLFGGSKNSFHCFIYFNFMFYLYMLLCKVLANLSVSLMLHDVLPLKMQENKYSQGAPTCVTYTKNMMISALSINKNTTSIQSPLQPTTAGTTALRLQNHHVARVSLGAGNITVAWPAMQRTCQNTSSTWMSQEVGKWLVNRL